MRYDYEGEHAYVLVLTRNLPINLPEVYIELIDGRSEHDDSDSDHHGDSSSEEDHSHRVSDEDEDDSSDHSRRKHGSHNHRAQELKIRVYNHTVELKNRRRLVVSIKDFFLSNILSHFPLAPFW